MEKKKEEKVLILEDDFLTALSAMSALNKMNIANIKIVGTYKNFLEMLENYKPTLVLSDAYVPEDKGKVAEDHRDKISEELDKRKIPYIFVTKARIKSTHDYNIKIIEKRGDEYKLLKEFDTSEKDSKIWEEAYERLKCKTKQNKEHGL